MSILDNAIDSINLGLEDYKLSTDDERRLISCTRNMYAGILLLYKHKLSTLSPDGSDEVLIKQKIEPTFGDDGQLEWIGKGRKTVEVREIEERFKSLGIKTHWAKLHKIQDYRNDIEHHHSQLPHETIRGLLSNSFIVIRDFISDELKIDPSELLEPTTWSTLISVDEVFQKERESCLEAIDGFDWQSESLEDALRDVVCEECGSELITVENCYVPREDVVFKCRTCQHQIPYELMIEQTMRYYFASEEYNAMRYGDDAPIIDCPDCVAAGE